MRNGVITVSILLGVGLGACSHEPEKAASVATPQAAAPAVAPARAAPATNTCSSDSDCGDKQLCIRSQCVNITPELAECNTVRVHFDFNDSSLRPDEEKLLNRMGRCLKADHDLHVSVEGNADERGTEEWNIALGDKRATAVAEYLERLGVSKAQLKTVSYGKERPLCVAHDEACWSTNRRAALKPRLAN